MALALNRTGEIFKKCDRSNHRPQSNQRCREGKCQHASEPSQVGRWQRAWTLRYWVNGKQLEKSFKDAAHATTGRVSHASGRKLAQDFQLKLTVDKRSGDVTFADHSKSGKQNFGDAVEAYISRLSVGERSKQAYLTTYRVHVKAVFGDRTLTQVAKDRDRLFDLLTVAMKDLSITPRQQARMIIVGTCDDAVKAGKLSRHYLADIELPDDGPKKLRSDFVFPTHAQVKMVASGASKTADQRAFRGAGICVWLMRGCGLRIEEALAVEKSDFVEDGTVLRVTWQASRDGRKKMPLKHRKQGEYRDVPVPSWLWDMVKDLADGPLSPGHGSRLFEPYVTVRRRFARAADTAGIPDGFTAHSLRHAYASALLGNARLATQATPSITLIPG
jgi:integrase